MSDMSRRQFVESMAAAAAAPAAYALSSSAVARAATLSDRRGPRLTVERTVKVFDPTDRTGFGAVTNLASSIEDVTIIRRADRWQMIGEAVDNRGRLGFFSATLPPDAHLAATGWAITTAPGDPRTAINLVPNVADPNAWDYTRHNSSYARGWDPTLNQGRGGWQERLYYAGTNANYGPFAIGYLTWNGESWIPFANNPVLVATEVWEGPTGGTLSGVYEPNVIYEAGKWRIWYATGTMAQGYAESVDGRDWTSKKIYQPPTESIFDNEVIKSPHPSIGFETVFARFGLTFEPLPTWGLWWQHAPQPFDDPSQWSDPVQIVVAGDGTPWHTAGVWKPALHYSDSDANRAFLFFDGGYGTAASFGEPFTLGCAICNLET